MTQDEALLMLAEDMARAERITLAEAAERIMRALMDPVSEPLERRWPPEETP